MRTITIDEEATLDAPAEDVWTILADYARDPEWRAGVRSMRTSPAGPVQEGTRTDEELRFAGRTYRNTGEVLGVEGMSISWRTIEGADARGSRSVRALGPERSAVRLEVAVRPRGGERLLAPLFGRMLRRNVRGDLRRLDRLVPSGVRAAAAAGRS